MGCGASGDKRDGELQIDEIEEKKPAASNAQADSTPVEAFHPRNRYAAAADDQADANGDDDLPGDELAGRRPPAATALKRKKKKRDDDDDDEDEVVVAPQKDRDMERLLASYKDKKAPATSSTLYANKHVLASKRAEAAAAEARERASEERRTAPADRQAKVLKLAAHHESDDGADERAGADAWAPHGAASPHRHQPAEDDAITAEREQALMANPDVASLAQGQAFTLKHKPVSSLVHSAGGRGSSPVASRLLDDRSTHVGTAFPGQIDDPDPSESSFDFGGKGTAAGEAEAWSHANDVASTTSQGRSRQHTQQQRGTGDEFTASEFAF